MNRFDYGDIIDYHKSTASEFEAIKDRIRNLIGGANWGEEGRYKEQILKNAFSKYLPNNFSIGTGFVINIEEGNTHPNVSTQIDLIIYNKNRTVIFREGDFVIVAPDSVFGIIEVKTNLQNQKIDEIVENANKNGEFIVKNQVIQSRGIFNGIFGFEGYDKVETLENHIEKFLENKTLIYFDEKQLPEPERFIVNHISFNKDLFFRYWKQYKKYSLYSLENLSFSYFIFNLLKHISFREGKVTENETKLWFPVDKLSSKISEFVYNSDDKPIFNKIKI